MSGLAQALRGLLDPVIWPPTNETLNAARAALAAHDAAVAAGGWKVDIDLEATFPIDGRTENVVEITNSDHSETYAYAVDAQQAARIVACVNACQGIADPARLVAAARALRDSADDVVATWANGDLAGAVNVLDADADELREALS